MRRLILFMMAIGLHAMAWSQWHLQREDIRSEFRGLSVVDEKIAWASGSRNTCARTIDGGDTWEILSVPETEALDFRDVEAIDAETAYLLSIGSGTKSRIYKTTDGGKSWMLQFHNPDPKAFFDGFAFWNPREGIAVGDPVDGRFQVIRTLDGGAHWTPVPPANIPPALAGDGVFAASGTTITVYGSDDVWFATGGAPTARVFHSGDKGLTWTVASTPVIAGLPSTGIFSIAFVDALNGILVGGDYKKIDEARDNIARTADGGRTWTLVADSGLGGFRSCVAYLPGTKGQSLITTGPAGTDYSVDGGLQWKSYDTQGFHVLSFAPSGAAGWAAGAGGRIAIFAPWRNGLQ